ncbi:serine/threonine protein kinase [Marinospirillum insulare]|uniref:Stress response kinase A n=1 Tax=Marinospirillum insulare TaxID=217169 RepID=A0ABQ5ZVW7_9GAMM|nr:serine/threonine protein kinase [Marinospirillum insulare]GLR64159.1 stress response kinase A [Marinospirillum insulare]
MHEHPFAELTPDLVLNAVESLGLISDARVLTLNSYENRVYQVGIEDATPLIAKFYRPNRWSDAQILEEHSLSFELAELDIPLVAPIKYNNQSLFEYKGFRFCLFERRGGRAPEAGDLDQLYRLGQLLGRLHAVGAKKSFIERPELNVVAYGQASFEFLLNNNFLPKNLVSQWEAVVEDLLTRLTQLFAETLFTSLRIHGDCHPGNLLCRDESFFIVDLDDCRNGPAVQDLWMMLTGDRQEQTLQLSELMSGYNEFYDFSPRELPLIEGLRTLRILHYSAWLARRWKDPAFPYNFPWFGTEHYWNEQISLLNEQRFALDQPYLQLF